MAKRIDPEVWKKMDPRTRVADFARSCETRLASECKKMNNGKSKPIAPRIQAMVVSLLLCQKELLKILNDIYDKRVGDP